MTKTLVAVMAGRPVAEADSQGIPNSEPRITNLERITEAATYGALRAYTRILKSIGDVSELTATAQWGKVR